LIKPKQPAKKTLADCLVELIGSWKFIVTQSAVMCSWVVINISTPMKADPYPFILLNLMLSTQAALLGPIMLMSNNRQSEIDRKRNVDHYLIDVSDSELLLEIASQVEQIHKHVEHF
jgi:uncharacterized membrane protein